MRIGLSEKVHLTQLLRDVHFFDLTRLGRLSRAAFWCALLAHLFFLAVLFVVPFETAYGLQNVFLVALLAALVPIKRLAVRRLHDANFSGWWLWLLAIPYLGWLAVLVLLLLPSASFPNRFDRFAEPAERQKPR